MLRRFSAALLLVVAASSACSSSGEIGTGGSGGSSTGGMSGGSGGGILSLGGAGGGEGGTETNDVILEGGAGGADPAPPNGGAGGNSGALVCPSALPTRFYLSPDDSGSMASPVWARELLRQGILPDAARIRPWEFMNYHHFDFPEPPNGEPMQVHGELVTLDPGARWELLVAVRARSAPRPKVGMTFVVDTSASMAGPGMARARRVVTTLIEALQPGDVVNVVKWSSTATPVAENVVLTAESKGPLAQQVAEQLAPYGGSDLTGGLSAGYALAAAHAVEGGHNRVVLVSDGGASPSAYDLETIAKAVAGADAEQIFLTGVGVGPAAGYDDELMNAITDAARGSYAYVDEPERAPFILADRFDELMFVAEDSITLGLEVPGFLVVDASTAKGIGTDPNQIRDQHIAPGDTIFLRQELVLAPGCSAADVGAVGSLVATVWSGKLADMTSLAAASIPLPASDKASGNGLKARAIHAVAKALAAGSAAELADAQSKELAEALAALPNDDELDDLSETLALFFQNQP